MKTLPLVSRPACLTITIVLAAAITAPVRLQGAPGFLPSEDPRWIIVKLRDGTGGAWDGDAFRAATGETLPLGLKASEAAVERVFEKPARFYEDERARLFRLDGRSRPHLELYYTVRSPGPEATQALVEKLKGSPLVETVEVPTLPAPSPTSSTPDYSGMQTYLGIYGPPPPNPSPINVLPLKDMPGGTGQGIGFADIEYGWNLAHEDLPASISLLGPSPLVPSGLDPIRERHHGTASLGIAVGQQNGFGIDGIAPLATVRVAGSYTDSTQPYEVNLARAIDRARQALSAMDVLLIEAQIGGPSWDPSSASQVGVVPVEWKQVIFDAIRAAADKGIIVVEAAGNGSQNLDDAVYQGKFQRATRDSGALIVTSVWAFQQVNPPYVSNLGSRVDFYFWSEPVVTAGYGDLQDSPGDDQDYTRSVYGASSAASAIVAGGITALQGVVKSLFGSALTLAEARDLLVRTGAADFGPGYPVRPHFGAAVDNLLYNRWGFDPALAGVVSNPSFEFIQGVAGSTPAAWLGPAFSLNSVAAVGDITPTRGQKLLFFEDAVRDGRPTFLAGAFKLPPGASALALDWTFLAAGRGSDDACDAAVGSIWIGDPASGVNYPLSSLDLCIPMIAGTHPEFPRSTGWRTSYSQDLEGLEGLYLELHVEVSSRYVSAGSRKAAFVLDNVRFETPGAPLVAAIEPSRGSICGGTAVVVTGSGFSSGDTTVSIGGLSLLNTRWIDSRTILGETPPGAATGAAVVAVSSPRGNATLAGGFTYENQTCQKSFRRGDCNNDRGADLSDAIFSIDFLFRGGRTPPCLKACDANDDGAHDVSDAVFLLDYLFRGGSMPPAPFPGCSTDPTADQLSCSSPACP